MDYPATLGRDWSHARAHHSPPCVPMLPSLIQILLDVAASSRPSLAAHPLRSHPRPRWRPCRLTAPPLDHHSPRAPSSLVSPSPLRQPETLTLISPPPPPLIHHPARPLTAASPLHRPWPPPAHLTVVTLHHRRCCWADRRPG
jgi:hypothetical protein